jgi:hypothetical protein
VALSLADWFKWAAAGGLAISRQVRRRWTGRADKLLNGLVLGVAD